MSERSQRNPSSSGGSGGSYRASTRDRFPEVEYSDDFFGNSRYAATGLYYNISGERRPVPSLEVESDDAWRIRGQFCDIVYPGGVQGGSRKVCNMSIILVNNFKEFDTLILIWSYLYQYM